jgi:hypothetical protein
VIIAILATAVVSVAASPGPHARPAIEPMPAALETRFALSAAPPKLRDGATVYRLDPARGYSVARRGTNGVACLVERTSWDLADFRDDLYIPLCYDRAGATTYLRAILDAAALRARGMGPAELKAEIVKRYRDKTYRTPEHPGVSYMVAPVMRTVGPPDLRVHTMAMPHLMFYAPFVTNVDLAAAPDLGDPASLAYPFVDVQGAPAHSYMIQLLGAAERARILADEKALVDALCAYRDVLCLPPGAH